MTVYVDEMRVVSSKAPACFGKKRRKACHMIADDFGELEDIARKIGLRYEWKHNDHYDLTESKRKRAIECGAVEVNRQELVKILRALRGRKENDPPSSKPTNSEQALCDNFTQMVSKKKDYPRRRT